MTRTISGSPFRRSVFPILLGSAAIGYLTHLAIAWALPDSALRAPIASAIMAAVVFGIFALVLRIVYPPVSFDEADGSVRFGTRELAIANITRVHRGVSNSGAAAYLTYRLRSSDGASARVLVAGRPLRGIDEAGAQALRRLLELAPIADAEADGLSDAQRAIAASMVSNGRSVSIGKEQLLGELDALFGAVGGSPAPADADALSADEPDPAVASVALGSTGRYEDVLSEESPAPSEEDGVRLVNLWIRDDADAAIAIAALPKARAIWRRLGFWTLALAVVALVVVIVVAVVLENGSGGRLGSDTNASVAAWFLIAAAIGLVGAIVWSVAADLHNAQLRRAGRDWMAAGDNARRRRGLATQFMMPMADGANRTLVLGALLGGVFGLLLVVGGAVLIGTEPDLLGLALVLLPLGLVISGLAIWGWLASRRRTAAAAREFVLLGGLRIDPPAVVADAVQQTSAAAAAPSRDVDAPEA